MSDNQSKREVIRTETRDGVLLVTIDYPPVNSLCRAVVEGLQAAVKGANEDDAISAIVLTGAGGQFIAGADIHELEQLAANPEAIREGPKLAGAIEYLEANAKPIVAAIDGFALGGGLEVAMATHYRVGTTRCRLGLPELRLGLIPGAGGTQRLPRIVGMQKALEMMLTSREARGQEALALGLISELVEPDELLDAALAAARKLASGELEPIRVSQQSDKLPGAEEAEQMVQMARMMAGDKIRNLIHPDLCMDAVLRGITEGYTAGLAREAENFKKCITSPQGAGLIHIFFGSRQAPKVPGVTDAGIEPKGVNKVAVLGGGTMGSGITTSLLYTGMPVILKEINDELAQAGRGRVESNLSSRVKKGRISQEKFDDMMSRLTVQTDYARFDEIDFVIEAVIENIELKQQVFAELEKATRDDCILASNTSTIDIELIGKSTGAAERIVGTHFFSPAHVMPLVEVVRSRQTSPQTLLTAIELTKRLKKTPVTVGNCVGFLVNRIFFPYGQAAGLLVDHGVDLYRIDKVIYDFGMPMGPFRMGDLAGVDVAKFAGGIMADAYKDRVYRSTLVDHLFEAKRFGQKTGVGYYLYDGGRDAKEDPDLAALVDKARADAGNPAPLEIGDEEIIERVFFGVINEACRCLDEGVATRASDIDVASVMGMGFPPYRGGLMKYADTVGAGYICDKLATWAEAHGPMYAPSEYLRRKAGASESLLV